MDSYSIALSGFLIVDGVLLWNSRSRRAPLSAPSSPPSQNEPKLLSWDPSTASEIRSFLTAYFSVYILVMASDWLQGPYIYALYTTTHGLPPSTVAWLFTAGFLSGGISASFIGSLADRYGRARACLAFCVIYLVSCVLTIGTSDVWILGVGRILGGVATTLLCSVFESWMVAEHAKRNLDSRGISLADLFGWNVVGSGLTAIICRVVSEGAVGWSGLEERAPFVMAVLCLTAAGLLIWKNWPENYGDSCFHSGAELPTTMTDSSTAPTLLSRKVLALTLATTIFEGSMFLFVFHWTPALTTTHIKASNALPLGLIFSCFMSAMMLGSLLSASIPTKYSKAVVLGTLLLVSALSLSVVSALTHSETAIFVGFILFETCVGMYFPTIAELKSRWVPECERARVYGWMRLPLNVFVVVALGCTTRVDRSRIFAGLGVLLGVTGGVVGRALT